MWASTKHDYFWNSSYSMLRTPISKDELNRFPLKNSSTAISELGPSVCLQAGTSRFAWCLAEGEAGGWTACVSGLSSVAQCLTLCNPMDCGTPGFPVHLQQLLEFTQTHVQRVGNAIQPSHPLLSPSPPTFNLSQHQGLFQWVSSSHQVAKILEFQFQHQSFQWIFRTDFL